jgi:hypothetical protein
MFPNVAAAAPEWSKQVAVWYPCLTQTTPVSCLILLIRALPGAFSIVAMRVPSR